MTIQLKVLETHDGPLKKMVIEKLTSQGKQQRDLRDSNYSISKDRFINSAKHTVGINELATASRVNASIGILFSFLCQVV